MSAFSPRTAPQRPARSQRPARAQRAAHKTAAALIELVFAIVIIAFALSAMPGVIAASTKSDEVSRKIEEIKVLEYIGAVFSELPYSERNLCQSEFESNQILSQICADENAFSAKMRQLWDNDALEFYKFMPYSLHRLSHPPGERSARALRAGEPPYLVGKNFLDKLSGALSGSVEFSNILPGRERIIIDKSSFSSMLGASYVISVKNASTGMEICSPLAGGADPYCADFSGYFIAPEYCKILSIKHSKESAKESINLRTCSSPMGRTKPRYLQVTLRADAYDDAASDPTGTRAATDAKIRQLLGI